MENLMRLKIPAGWAITYNKFFDIDPIKSDDDSMENWQHFTEDIFQISKLSNEKSQYTIPNRHLLIDLGWFPDSCYTGQYKLSLIFYDPDSDTIWNYIEIFSSRDRFEIRDKIEEWLERLIHTDINSKSRQEIIKLLKSK